MTDPILALNTVSQILDALINLIPKIVMAASVFSALLPPTESAGWMAKLHKLINVMAFNFNHAKNKE